ncbi:MULTISPECIES: response regulator [Xanthomonas]|uniref:Transcriptional regulator n=8 Tax=Xanthomonas TaxID=338 RepID=A0AB34QF76_XANCH|nr:MULTISPECIES: response regulator [Xanthomonas]ATS23498.1 response regulator [Xanthomonas phaseoli pv. phaseoli]ATS26388.1 response regulator [Xanthomonas phaseoli pv. phaseoli]ATS30127.1 response regulator [Xanthomonas phaseoli pv. phaseoli]ATS34652.1 response regulator [Xanthomonas phaseoli pv. phaseoli]AZU11426.1 transcriptional regulator [Xanthomonas phaseoli pv. phaseoli]
MSSASPLGHVLIVEDEPRLAAVLGEYLHAAGYSHDWIADGAQALGAFRAQQPDLVLLDLMLPNRGGLDICRDLRKESAVPVIMVTARVEEIDRLLGLEIGADDYICKPFSPREVVARVQAVLRRHRHDPHGAPAPGLQIDEDACRASVHGRVLDLTQVEFRLLRTLAAAPGRVYSREQLMGRLYADHRIVTDRTVDSHVKNLRRKLADAGGEDWVRSVYGAGYRFEP